MFQRRTVGRGCVVLASCQNSRQLAHSEVIGLRPLMSLKIFVCWLGWLQCSLIHFLTFPQYPRSHKDHCPLRQTTCVFEPATLHHPASWDEEQQNVMTKEVVRLRANPAAFSKWRKDGLSPVFPWRSEMFTLRGYLRRSPRSTLTRRSRFRAGDWKKRTGRSMSSRSWTRP